MHRTRAHGMRMCALAMVTIAVVLTMVISHIDAQPKIEALRATHAKVWRCFAPAWPALDPQSRWGSGHGRTRPKSRRAARRRRPAARSITTACPTHSVSQRDKGPQRVSQRASRCLTESPRRKDCELARPAQEFEDLTMPSRLGAKVILSRVDCIAILHDEAELMPWMDRWTYRDDAVSM